MREGIKRCNASNILLIESLTARKASLTDHLTH